MYVKISNDLLKGKCLFIGENPITLFEKTLQCDVNHAGFKMNTDIIRSVLSLYKKSRTAGRGVG